jgi:opacity protein-like surface antigen
MTAWLRTGLPVLVALAFAAPAAAQSQATDRVGVDAAVGPSFANTGTTFAASAGLNVVLNDRTSLVGEFGTMQRAPFRDAVEIAPPAPDNSTARVNAYHWNANLKVRPFEVARFEPYVTGGLGWFSADTIVNDQVIGTTHFEDRRRATDFATNVGAGVTYRLTDWLGVGGDYRTFFVYRDNSTPRVNRFTAGLTLSLK